MDRQTQKINAQDTVAGRLASRVAFMLQGKHKVEYMPHVDCGDFVQIAHVDKMKFTGKKLEKNLYHSFTGYPGGITTKKLSDLFSQHPDELLRKMVYNMLPKNKLRQHMIKRLTFIKEKAK